MIFFQFLLFMPVLVFAVNHHINNGLLVRREDTYDFTGDDVFSGADYMNADPLDNADPNDPDYTLFLDDTPNQDDFNLVSSDCSSQPTGKLRSREQCDNPSAPKLEIPPLDTIDSAAIELKQRCEDTEKRLCCAGDEINFWNGFRSIVLNCAEYFYGCYYPGEEWCCRAFMEGVGVGRFTLPYGIGCVQIAF